MSCASLAESVAHAPSALAPSSPSHDTDALGERIAALAARLHAATYELLVLLGQFDAENGWNNGFLSCAHWLHWRTGIDLGAAREKVRVARALPALPAVSARMQRGQLSYAKVRALTRVATPENEQSLVEFALAGTAAQVERFVRACRRVDRVAAAREDESRHLAFGRLVVEELWQRHAPRWPEETRAAVREYLASYVEATWREYYNPDVYRDAGLPAPYELARTAFAAAPARARREEVQRRCVRVLDEIGLWPHAPETHS